MDDLFGDRKVWYVGNGAEEAGVGLAELENGATVNGTRQQLVAYQAPRLNPAMLLIILVVQYITFH